MSELSQSPPAKRRLQSRSCLTCYQRKIRCDRGRPSCHECKRASGQCTYPESRITRRRPCRDESTLSHVKRPHVPVDALAGLRLTQQTSPPYKGSASYAYPERLITDANGKSRLFSSDSWVYSQPKIGGLDDLLLTTLDSGLASETSLSNIVTSPASFARGNQCPTCSERDNLSAPWRPTTAQLETCWHIFVEGIDPVIRILHKPSVRKLIDQAMQHGFQKLDKTSTVLLLVICYSAIMSMSDWKCKAIFDAPRLILMQKSSLAVDSGFQEAGLIHTHDMSALQAFVLYLSCKPRGGSRSIWTLAGVAIRIALSLGLQRDGSQFNLPPFQVEMRRRLWWQVMNLDLRSSEDYSLHCFLSIYRDADTKVPLNLNDTDIDPSMEQTPTPRRGLSDMTFVRMRSTMLCAVIGRLDLVDLNVPKVEVKREPNSPALYLKSSLLDELSVYIKSEYLDLFEQDVTSPICRFGSESGRLVLAKLRLKTDMLVLQKEESQGKPNVVNKAAVDSLFESAIEVLEAQTRLGHDPVFAPYQWLMASHVQWHAATFVLMQLCMHVEALARANRASEDEDARVHLEMLPSLLRRAIDASESMFEGLQSFDDTIGNERWGLLQKIREMVKRRIERSDGAAEIPSLVDGMDIQDLDWSALGLDELFFDADLFSPPDTFLFEGVPS